MCIGMQTTEEEYTFLLANRETVLNIVYPATTLSNDEPEPLTFGECSNVTCININTFTHRYQVHDGAIHAFTDVRDRGLTADLPSGQFTRTAQATGAITADVEGDAPYTANALELVERIAKRYSDLTSSDIDSSTLAALAATHPQTVGLHVSKGDNLLSDIDWLLQSVGCARVFTRDGKLSAVKISAPSGTPVASLNPDHFLYQTFEVQE